MADDGDVVYLPGQTGCRQVRSWRLRVAGGFARVVTAGTLADGRWWVSALWHYPTGYAQVCGAEHEADAQAMRLREVWAAHPGEWVVERNVVRQP